MIILCICQCFILKLTVPFMHVTQKRFVHTGFIQILYCYYKILLIPVENGFNLLLIYKSKLQNSDDFQSATYGSVYETCSNSCISLETQLSLELRFKKKSSEILNPDITSYH